MYYNRKKIFPVEHLILFHTNRVLQQQKFFTIIIYLQNDIQIIFWEKNGKISCLDITRKLQYEKCLNKTNIYLSNQKEIVFS